MDYYLDINHCNERLLNEWIKYGSLIIAVDFDNTIYDYHNDGHTYEDVINLIKECKNLGCYIVIFTAKEETDYGFICSYCKTIEFDYDSINENAPNLPYKARKIYYNILLDDRAGLSSAFQSLSYALENFKKYKRIQNLNFDFA